MKTVTIDNKVWEICDNEQFEKQNNKYAYKTITQDDYNKNICYDSVQKLNKAILRQKILVRKKK